MNYRHHNGKYIVEKDGVFLALTPAQVCELRALLYSIDIDADECPLHKMTSLECYEPGDGARVYIVHSPVECERDTVSMRQALGRLAVIDGELVRIIAFERPMPATPIRIGERIGIRAQPIQPAGPV